MSPSAETARSLETEIHQFPKDFLEIGDLTPTQFRFLLVRAQRFARERGQEGIPRPLAGKTIGLIFEKPSLRTTLSLQVAVTELGGTPIVLTQEGVQMGTREPVSDIGGVLQKMIHGVVARVNRHDTLEQLAESAPAIPVINGLSNREHPLQSLADMQTILEKKGRLSGVSLAYVGDGNNVARSLALASGLLGLDFRIASPTGYGLPIEVIERVIKLNEVNGGRVVWTYSPEDAVEGADVVYTDTWTSMGQEEEKEKRLRAFSKYQVTEELMRLANPDAIFMHCLPAHREQEVEAAVIDGPQSVVFAQAENRLHTAKAVLATFVH